MTVKGLRQFLDPEHQRGWLEGEADLRDVDAAERDESLEQRFKYAARFQKLLKRPQAEEVLNILRLYAETCLPIPRQTERYYWSVSCLPGSPDRPLVRISASFMELFALHADGDGLRSRFILHLSDFTSDGSPEPEQLDTDLLESCVLRPEDMDYAIWRDGKSILIAKVRGPESIRHFIAHPHGLRAIRNFNLTHMNRGRNAYQASHCYSLADAMLDDRSVSAF
ncbi:MAG TPA: hypothetical protein VFT61_06505 [Sphingomicrobium sp.]|nr:hypothetical protein [Sphingomicrobium sp.]